MPEDIALHHGIGNRGPYSAVLHRGLMRYRLECNKSDCRVLATDIIYHGSVERNVAPSPQHQPFSQEIGGLMVHQERRLGRFRGC